MKYNNTNLAYDISEYNEVDEIVEEVKKENKAKKKNTGLFKFICMLYVVLMIGSLLIKTANINEQKTALIKTEQEYNDIVNDNKKTEVRINSKIDLRKVEEIAIASLNMNRPKKSQTVYINTNPKDYGEVVKEKNKNKNGENIFASLVKSINGIFSYSK